MILTHTHNVSFKKKLTVTLTKERNIISILQGQDFDHKTNLFK